MTSQDDLTLLRQMYQRGEIGADQYDALRRHVLWGTPLPQLIDEAPAGPVQPREPSGYEPPAYLPPVGGPGYPPPRDSGARPGGRAPEDTAAYAAFPLAGADTRGGDGRGEDGPGSDGSGGDGPGWDRAGQPVRSGQVGTDEEPAPPRRRRAGDERGDARPGRRRAGDERGDAPPGRRRAGDERSRTRGSSRPEGAVPAGAAAAPRGRTGPRRARRRRSLFAVLTSVVLALALAGAGVWWLALREMGVPPAQYARSVCGSVRDWQQAVDSGGSRLVSSIAREEDRGTVRSAVTTYYTGLAGRTDQLRVAVIEAGVADAAGGKAYADSLAAAVGDQATELRDLAARAGRLDPREAATFQVQLRSLLTGSETAVSEVSAALARPPAGTPAALRTALSAEPACAPYVG